MLTKTNEDALRVMMLTQRFPPLDCTGAPLQAWHLGKALSKLGQEVQVTTTRPLAISGSRDPGAGEMSCVTELAYLGLPGAAAITRFGRGVGVTFPAARWHVVHGHALSPLVLGAALGKRADSAPFLVKPSIGGDHPEGEIRRIRRSPAYPVFRKALHKIDLFAVLDDLIEEDLESVGIPPERRRRVDNGIDLGAYHPATAPARAALRAKFGLPPGARVLLFCGQLSTRKGIDELLAAWSPQLARERKAVLVVCGDGPLREAVIARASAAEGHVVYLGAVADSTEVMRMADVLILPSRCESFGNVIIEALACGVPVAATACGIAPRVLADGRCGWLMAEPGRAAIGETLQTVFAESASWQQKATEGKAVAAQFSMERTARMYLDIYRQLITGRASRDP